MVRGRRAADERYPEAVRMAKRLHRANPVTHKRMSLRKIAAELAKAGHMMERGYGDRQVARPFNLGTIKAMIEGAAPAAGDA